MMSSDTMRQSLLVVTLLLLWQHPRILVDAFANNLVAGTVGCMTDLSTDEVIMNNQVLSAADSDFPNIHLEIVGDPAITSLPASRMLQLVNPYDASQLNADIQFVVETTAGARFEYGGCDGNKRISGRIQDGPVEILFPSAEDAALPPTVQVWAGWATGHEAVRLTQPVTFHIQTQQPPEEDIKPAHEEQVVANQEVQEQQAAEEVQLASEQSKEAEHEATIEEVKQAEEAVDLEKVEQEKKEEVRHLVAEENEVEQNAQVGDQETAKEEVAEQQQRSISEAEEQRIREDERRKILEEEKAAKQAAEDKDPSLEEFPHIDPDEQKILEDRKKARNKLLEAKLNARIPPPEVNEWKKRYQETRRKNRESVGEADPFERWKDLEDTRSDFLANTKKVDDPRAQFHSREKRHHTLHDWAQQRFANDQKADDDGFADRYQKHRDRVTGKKKHHYFEDDDRSGGAKSDTRLGSFQKLYDSDSFGSGTFELQYHIFASIFFVVAGVVVLQLCLWKGKRDKGRRDL